MMFIKNLVNKVKKQLIYSDKNSLEVDTISQSKVFIGEIDHVSKNKISGWVSMSDKTSIRADANVFIQLNEDNIPIQDLFYRLDLEESRIADGIAAFEINVDLNDDTEYQIQLFGGEQLIRKKSYLENNINLKNNDYIFDKYYQKVLSRNQSQRIDEGIYIQRVGSNIFEKFICGSYFYRINNLLNNSYELIIGQAIKKRIYSNDIVHLKVNSEVVNNAYIELLDVHGNSKYSSRFRLDVGWKDYSLPLLSCSDSDLQDIHSIKIVINVGEHCYLDLGQILIIGSKEVFIAKKSSKNLSKSGSFTKSLINGKFLNSSLQPNASSIKRKQALAAGVFYEESPEKSNNVFASIVGETLKLDVRELRSYCRIAFAIDYLSIKTKPLFGRIDLKTEVDNPIKAIYLYSRGNVGKIEKRFKLDFKINEGNATYELFMSEVEVKKLINSQNSVYEIRLAIEFNKVSIFSSISVSLGQDNLIDDAAPTDDRRFEDEVIEQQFENLNGFYDVVSRDQPNNIQSARIPKIYPTKYQAEVDILIPVFNAKEYVLRCIDSLIKFTTVPFRIILMDDGSTDGVSSELELIASNEKRICYFHNEINVGYTKNVNMGMSKATSEWVVLLNSDTEVTPYWLENILSAVDDGVAIVGPLSNAASWQSVPNVMNSNGEWDFNLLPNGLEPKDIAYYLNTYGDRDFPDVGLLNGFCQLINRVAFITVGGLDEVSFPKGYGEENDLCARFVKQGYKLRLCTTSYVYHHKSKSFGHEIRSSLSKSGSENLKLKHPDYDWSLVSKQLYNSDALIHSREITAQVYKVLI